MGRVLQEQVALERRLRDEAELAGLEVLDALAGLADVGGEDGLAASWPTAHCRGPTEALMRFVLVLDAGFQIAIDCFNEILAVIAGMETDT